MKNIFLLAIAFIGLAFAQAENAPPIYDVGDDVVSVEITAQDFKADVDLYTMEVVQSNKTAEVTAQKVSFQDGNQSVAILTKNRGCHYLLVTSKRKIKDVGWRSNDKDLLKKAETISYYKLRPLSRYYGSSSGGLANS